MIDRTISVAPMMDYTDRHFRYLLRLISKHTLLYTEMVTTGAILHGDKKRFLDFDQAEHAVALQLGGSHAEELTQCAQLAQQWGYDEVNLNVGCPSDRVQSGRFGACLMAEPELVAECFRAMQDKLDIPVTIKTRIGIDEYESYEHFKAFVDVVAEAGCQVVIIHARKAWLQGLSPKQNREIPPLRYDYVYRLKQEMPELSITINGGITDLEQTQQHLAHCDGVMLGRAVCHNPYLLAEVDQAFYQAKSLPLTREQVVMQYLNYMQQQFELGVPLSRLAKPLFGLFQGQANGKKWRRYLSENIYQKENGVDVIQRGLETIF